MAEDHPKERHHDPAEDRQDHIEPHQVSAEGTSSRRGHGRGSSASSRRYPKPYTVRIQPFSCPGSASFFLMFLT